MNHDSVNVAVGLILKARQWAWRLLALCARVIQPASSR